MFPAIRILPDDRGKGWSGVRLSPSRPSVGLAEQIRWLAFCLPVGLYKLWLHQRRIHWPLKAVISLVSIAFCACSIAGIISLFSTPLPVMAQTAPVQIQVDLYPLVVDVEGTQYHLEGCIYAPASEAIPITLAQAARQGIPADERCNPPRHQAQ